MQFLPREARLLGAREALLGRAPSGIRSLTAMAERQIGVVVEVRATPHGRADRLLALGVTPGARITVLQCFPGIVFLCDQTELAVERGVAEAILIRPLETRV